MGGVGVDDTCGDGNGVVGLQDGAVDSMFARGHIFPEFEDREGGHDLVDVVALVAVEMDAPRVQRFTCAAHHLPPGCQQNIKMHTRNAAAPYLAHSQFALAQVLRTRDESGDVSSARSLVNEAWQTAASLGMSVLDRKSNALASELAEIQAL